MKDFWNSFFDLGNLWYWSIGLIIVFPIIILLLNEIGYFVRRRDQNLVKPIRTIKTLIVPLIALVVLLLNIFDFGKDAISVKILQTIIWVLAINVGLDIISNLFLKQGKNGKGSNIPQLFLDIFRVFLVLLGGTIVLSSVWNIELGGLVTALGLGSFVLGLALQDTLGNLFSGIALVYEKPFVVGDYIKVEDRYGQVIEMNWRAVHILTREKELIIIPHLMVGQNVIMNFSKPSLIHILKTNVSFSYDNPPNQVKEALLETCLNTPEILHDPEPEVKTVEYSDSGITYEIEFAIDGFERHEEITDELMTRIWYTAQRHHLKIPFAQMTIHNAKEELTPVQAHDLILRDTLRKLPSYLQIDIEKSRNLETGSQIQFYGKNEVIIRQGDHTGSLYVILEGSVELFIETARGEKLVINTIHQGDFFGEVALLSSRTSSMTVVALSDIKIMLIKPSEVLEMVSRNPKLAHQMDEVMDVRRKTREKHLEKKKKPSPKANK